MLTKRTVLICLAVLFLTIAFSMPSYAANGSMGLELSLGDQQIPSVFMRINTSLADRVEAKIGAIPSGGGFLVKGEVNLIRIFTPGGDFTTLAKLGIGCLLENGTVAPDLHFAVGATYLLTSHLQLASDVSIGYREGQFFTTLNVGLGILFFD